MNAPEAPKQAIAAAKPEKTPSPYAAMNEQIAKFVGEYRKESDRACVILCAAKIDYLCGQILAKFLLPNASGQDDLLDTDRALGTFSARIHASYRLGLIDAEFARALHLFRRLRNSFAHEVSDSTFDHGPHRDRIQELVRPLSTHASYGDFKNKIGKDKSGPAADFYAIAAIIIVRLERLLHDLKPLSGVSAVAMLPPGWKIESPQKA